MERVNKEVPTVGILSKEGVVLGAERKEPSKLLDDSKFNLSLVKEMGKMYKIDDHVFCAISGLVGDGNYLIDTA